MRKLLAVALVSCSTVVLAQSPQEQKPASAAAPTAAAPAHQPANVRVDVTITDYDGDRAASPKTMTVISVDGVYGRLRSPFQDRQIAVDAQPLLLDGRLRLNITIESNAFRSPGMSKEEMMAVQLLDWKSTFSLLLDSGKPVVAYESSDASTKRKMTVEVKATILK